MRTKVERKEGFVLVEFELEGAISPEKLREITLEKLGLELKDARSGIVISGRGPIWLYSYLCHLLHPFRWVACFDPRLGAVVVQSHGPEVRVGDVIEL